MAFRYKVLAMGTGFAIGFRYRSPLRAWLPGLATGFRYRSPLRAWLPVITLMALPFIMLRNIPMDAARFGTALKNWSCFFSVLGVQYTHLRPSSVRCQALPRMVLMSSYPKSRISTSPIQAVVRSLQLADGLPFADILTEKDIRQAFDDAECHFAEKEEDIYSPAVTLWAFLSQMLFTGPARSCNAAVQRVRELCRFLGKTPPSLNSSGYCKARNKIDEAVPEQLIRTIAEKSERKVRKNWKWCDRNHLYLVDGSHVKGSDTPNNQEEYPQPTSQWMSPEQYQTIPETLELRLVEVVVAEKGFRNERFLWRQRSWTTRRTRMRHCRNYITDVGMLSWTGTA